MVNVGVKGMGQMIKNLKMDINMNKRLQRQKDTIKNYKLYSVIGRGAFGEVRLARNIETSKYVFILRLSCSYKEIVEEISFIEETSI